MAGGVALRHGVGMSTGTPTEPLEPPPGPRRLVRSRSDRVIAGVAGGLGRHFDVDPVVFRIGLAALALFGGVGVFVYLAALLFVPDEGGARAPFDRSRALTIAGTFVLVIAAVSAVGDGDFFWGPIVWLALLGGVGYAIFRAVRGGAGGSPTFGRVVLWLAVGTGAVLALSALAIGSAWAAAEGSGAVVAGVVIAIGAALVASALRPRGARWLVIPALAVAIPLGVISAADVRFDGGFGDREYRPVAVADIPAGGYRIGAGAISVDLRETRFPPAGQTVLDLQVGMGAAEVLVPEGVCVETNSRFGAGAATITGREAAGLDVDFVTQVAPQTKPRLLVRADVGLGALRVARGPEIEWDHPNRGWTGDWDHDAPSHEDQPGDAPDADDGDEDDHEDHLGDEPPDDAGCTVTVAEAG